MDNAARLKPGAIGIVFLLVGVDFRSLVTDGTFYLQTALGPVLLSDYFHLRFERINYLMAAVEGDFNHDEFSAFAPAGI